MTKTLSMVFREVGEGLREKVFIDRDLTPKGVYPTREFFKVVPEDVVLEADVETYTVYDADLTPRRYVPIGYKL